MKYQRCFLTIVAFILLCSLLNVGCNKDDDGPVGPEEPAPPSFNISSVNVDLQGGAQGIQFFARTNKDISLIRVNIKNPIGNQDVYNVGGNVFLTDEVIALQDANFGYVRVSGTWEFRFVGNLEPGKQSFDVTQPLNVSAKPIP
jgi:hypothetical protein